QGENEAKVVFLLPDVFIPEPSVSHRISDGYRHAPYRLDSVMWGDRVLEMVPLIPLGAISRIVGLYVRDRIDFDGKVSEIAGRFPVVLHRKNELMRRFSSVHRAASRQISALNLSGQFRVVTMREPQCDGENSYDNSRYAGKERGVLVAEDGLAFEKN